MRSVVVATNRGEDDSSVSSTELTTQSNPDFPDTSFQYFCFPFFFMWMVVSATTKTLYAVHCGTYTAIWLQWKLSLWKWSIAQFPREAQPSSQHWSWQSDVLHNPLWKGPLVIIADQASEIQQEKVIQALQVPFELVATMIFFHNLLWLLQIPC